jgi:hypothetical protein
MERRGAICQPDQITQAYPAGAMPRTPYTWPLYNQGPYSQPAFDWKSLEELPPGKP